MDGRGRALPLSEIRCVQADDRQSALHLEAGRVRHRLVVASPMNDNLRPKIFKGVDLIVGNSLREADHGTQITLFCHIGHGPAVVAGGDGYDTSRLFFRGEVEYLVGGSADFERAGRLQDLRL